MDMQVARKLFDQKVRKGIFNPVNRHLSLEPEDRMQTAVGLVWKLYAEHAADGEVLDDALLVHACRLRAIDWSRHLGPGGSKKDICDPRNKQERLTLEDIGYARWLKHDPTSAITSALDLGRWYNSLEEGDQELLELRVRGETLKGVGRALGKSTSWVFSRCKKLGEELAQYADASDGEQYAAAAE